MKRWREKWSWEISAFIALVVVSWAATASQMNILESEVFHLVYAVFHPLQQLMLIITQLGGLGMLLVSIVVAFAVNQRKLALQLVIGGGLATVVVTILKSLISRPRPFDVLESIIQYDKFATGFGYPSGHTAIIVSLALLLWPVVPRSARWIIVLLAVLVAASRISLGVHAPLDVIGGALIAFIAVRLTQRFFPLYSKPAKNKS